MTAAAAIITLRLLEDALACAIADHPHTERLMPSPPIITEDDVLRFARSIVAWLRGPSATSEKLDRLSAQLIHLTQGIKTMSDTFASELATLQADVAAQSSVIASATTAFQGLAAQIAAAEAAAKAAGATDAQVAAIASVRQGLEANTATLAAAIPANTPAQSPVPPGAPASPDQPASPDAPASPAA